MLNFYTEENVTDFPFADKQCVTIFMSGCESKCVGCHNPHLQKPHIWTNAEKFEAIEEIKVALQRSNTNYLVLCGGDPLFHKNWYLTRSIITTFKDRGCKICVYTGFSLKQIHEAKLDLGGVDYLKVGAYDQSQYINWPLGTPAPDNKFRLATKNQRMLKLPELEDVTDLNFEHETNNTIHNN